MLAILLYAKLRDNNSTFFKKLNFTLPCAKSKVKFHCDRQVAISPDFNRISLILHLIRHFVTPSPQGEGYSAFRKYYIIRKENFVVKKE